MRTLQEDTTKWKASLLKTSVSLANSTAKIAFLTICISLGILPKGFKLKFSLQSGLPKEVSGDLEESIGQTLSKASLELLNTTKEADVLKASLLRSQLETVFGKLEDKELYANLASSKFRKILSLRLKVHQNKLRKLVNGPPPTFLDIDSEVRIFESKMSEWILPSSQALPLVDWFDNSEFPPLPSPVRPDWTRDLQSIPLVSSSERAITTLEEHSDLQVLAPTVPCHSLSSSSQVVTNTITSTASEELAPSHSQMVTNTITSTAS